MNIDWERFLSLSYWFEGFTGVDSKMVAPVILKDSPFFWMFLGFFSSFIIFAIILKVSKAYLHKEHPFQSKIDVWSANFSIFGFLGLFWFLARETEVGLLSGRFWLLILGGYFAVFLYFVTRYFTLFYPIELAHFKKSIEPKSKK